MFKLFLKVCFDKTFLKSFVFGSFLAVIICLSISYFNFQESRSLVEFRESNLSHFMHRSYWATYLVLAFAFTLYLLIKKEMKFWMGIPVLLIFLVTVFLTGSKMGILLLILTAVTFLFYLVRQTKQIKWSIITTFSFACVIGLVLYLSPSISNRLTSSYNYLIGNYSIDKENTESTASRILVWETATEIIKENPIFGVGTGDVKDVIIERNRQKGNIDVANKKLNAHNQFLNSWVALGVLGMLFLLFVFIFPFIYTNNEIKFISRIIIFILFTSMLSESFLETQAGIIPVAFLICLIPALRLKN